MKLIKVSVYIFLILLLNTLVTGVGAVGTSSADDGNAFEPYWHQVGLGSFDNANSLPPRPLLKLDRDAQTLLIPVTKGESQSSTMIVPADPPADLLSSGEQCNPDTIAPEFVRSLSSGFIPNRGQYDPAVKYVLQYQGTTVFFTREGLVLTHTAGDEKNLTTDVIRQTFGGAYSDISITGLEEREGRVNYYVGNGSSQWLTDIPVYGKILYEDLYPGIDLVYSEENGRLKREFRVAPGANPDLIEILYDGGISPYVDDAGILRFVSPAGEMIESPLICWQVIGSEEVPRSAEYLIEEGSVRITVEKYDPEYALIIDPELVYSTHMVGVDELHALAPDGSGGIWVTGVTSSTYFPLTSDAYQRSKRGVTVAFISRFSSDGALLYSTYLGGRHYDWGYALAPDGDGGVWVAGTTWSTDFPVTWNAYQRSYRGSYFFMSDIFVSHFSSDGALLYSTYLGGSDIDEAPVLAPDGSGGVWVAGTTDSVDFPVTRNAYQGVQGDGKGPFIYTYSTGKDAFVSRFSSSGVLLYSTYLGGSKYDYAPTLAPDDAGGVWVAGTTMSTNFPVTEDALQKSQGGGNHDVFVSHISSDGALLYSTYLGGSSSDEGYALAPDGAGGVWVTGETRSDNFPVTKDAYQKKCLGYMAAFVTRFSSQGELLYSTYLGGSYGGDARALMPDGAGGVWVAGTTSSSDFPVTEDAYRESHEGGNRDAFLSRFSSSGSLLYSTYLGGSRSDYAPTLAPDDAGGVWVAGRTGGSSPFVARFSVENSDAYQWSYKRVGDESPYIAALLSVKYSVVSFFEYPIKQFLSLLNIF